MKKFLFIFYGLVLIGLAIFSYAFIDPNLTYYKSIYSGFAFENRALVTYAYVGIITLLFLCYFLFVRLAYQNTLSKKDSILLIVLSGILLIAAYPAMLSYDIFNYLTTAKVFFFYHENPYIIMPIEFIGDPYLLFTHAANKVALYGPGWILMTGIPHLVGIGNFFLTIISFKLFILSFYFGTILLIWKLTKRLLPVVLFALNPLVLLEILVSGHNDIVMMFFALASFFLLQRKKYLFASLIFIVSVSIKYASLFLLPVLLFVFWQTIRHKQIRWDKIFFFSALSMFVIFFLSPLREEMYSWYAVWILTFAFLIPEKKSLLYFSFALTVGLLLRYVPYMYSGTYLGQTPLIKIIVTTVPLLIGGGLLFLQKKGKGGKRA